MRAQVILFIGARGSTAQASCCWPRRASPRVGVPGVAASARRGRSGRKQPRKGSRSNGAERSGATSKAALQWLRSRAAMWPVPAEAVPLRGRGAAPAAAGTGKHENKTARTAPATARAAPDQLKPQRKNQHGCHAGKIVHISTAGILYIDGSLNKDLTQRAQRARASNCSRAQANGPRVAPILPRCWSCKVGKRQGCSTMKAKFLGRIVRGVSPRGESRQKLPSCQLAGAEAAPGEPVRGSGA